jgi:hypothetical protein
MRKLQSKNSYETLQLSDGAERESTSPATVSSPAVNLGVDFKIASFLQ